MFSAICFRTPAGKSVRPCPFAGQENRETSSDGKEIDNAARETPHVCARQGARHTSGGAQGHRMKRITI